MTDERLSSYVSLQTEFIETPDLTYWDVGVKVCIPQLGVSGTPSIGLGLDPGFSEQEAKQIGLSAGIAVAKELLNLIG